MKRQRGSEDKEEIKKPLKYFDYNATTPLDQTVIDVIATNLKDSWGNPSSSHVFGKAAKEVIVLARNQVGQLINSKPDDILFTSGGTEANNLIFYSILKYFEKPHIIISSIEHDSVMLPAKNFEKQGKIKLTIIKPNKYGFIEPDQVEKELTSETCLVSIMLANNETGIIQPIKEIGKKIQSYQNSHNQKIFFHSDAAQALGKISVDVEDLQVDYLTIVGHKFYGPRIGALYARNLKSEKPPILPLFFGGGQENSFRPGTENTAMIAGLGQASLLVSTNLQKYHDHMKSMRDYFEQSLLQEFGQQGVCFNGKHEGICDRIPNTSNFSILCGMEGGKILNHVHNFVASLGAACHSHSSTSVSPILLESGIKQEVAKSAIRFSIGRETTKDEIDEVVQELVEVVKNLKSIQK